MCRGTSSFHKFNIRHRDPSPNHGPHGVAMGRQACRDERGLEKKQLAFFLLSLISLVRIKFSANSYTLVGWYQAVVKITYLKGLWWCWRHVLPAAGAKGIVGNHYQMISLPPAAIESHRGRNGRRKRGALSESIAHYKMIYLAFEYKAE